MNLQQIFEELLINSGFPNKIIVARWTELEKAYSHKSRYYHNLNHLKEMIACFEKYRDELQFPDEVLYAIFYHDYVYNSTRKDNELKSAEFAVKILPENTTIKRELVFDLIMATKNHQPKSTEDEKWIIDFDLKILSKDWEAYKTYYQQIRKEYSIYPDFLYNPGRKKALLHFLEHEHIFQTKIFRDLYEQQARQNILQEINSL